MNNSFFRWALAASLSLHALTMVSFDSLRPGSGSAAAPAVFDLAYVRYSPQPGPLTPPPGPPAPDAPTALKKSTPASSAKSTFSSLHRPKFHHKHFSRPRSAATGFGAPAAPPADAPRGSVDLLSDPQRGKVFTHYFSEVKERIDRTVRRRYRAESLGKGTVSLYFVLNADGSVDRVSVLDRQSDANPEVRDFAVLCVSGSGPFAPFPKELDVKKISFNVTLLFSEL